MALKIMFGNLATDYIQESGREIKDVAEEIGKTPSNQFSKWKAGKWTYIAERKLLRIIEVIARRDRERSVNLMMAYLIDMCPETYRHVIDISPRVGESVMNATLAGQSWTPTLRAKLEAIGAAYARDRHFMGMVDKVGEWAGAINKEKP